MKVKARKKRTNDEIIRIIVEGLTNLQNTVNNVSILPIDRMFEYEILAMFRKHSNVPMSVFDLCTCFMSELSRHPFYGGGKEQKIFKMIFGVDFFELFNDWDELEDLGIKED